MSYWDKELGDDLKRAGEQRKRKPMTVEETNRRARELAKESGRRADKEEEAPRPPEVSDE